MALEPLVVHLIDATTCQSNQRQHCLLGSSFIALTDDLERKWRYSCRPVMSMQYRAWDERLVLAVYLSVNRPDDSVNTPINATHLVQWHGDGSIDSSLIHKLGWYPLERTEAEQRSQSRSRLPWRFTPASCRILHTQIEVTRLYCSSSSSRLCCLFLRFAVVSLGLRVVSRDCEPCC